MRSVGGRDVAVRVVTTPLGLESAVGAVRPSIGGGGETSHSGNTTITAPCPPSPTLLKLKLQTKHLTGLSVVCKAFTKLTLRFINILNCENLVKKKSCVSA